MRPRVGVPRRRWTTKVGSPGGLAKSPRRRWVPGIVIAGLIMLGACRIGINPAASPVAQSPHGATVRIDWRGEDKFWPGEGELVMVSDSGLYLLHSPYLVLYPIGAPARISARDAPGVGIVDLERRPTEDQLAGLAHYARHPYGLDDEGLARLVEALGSDSIRMRERR